MQNYWQMGSHLWAGRHTSWIIFIIKRVIVSGRLSLKPCAACVRTRIFFCYGVFATNSDSVCASPSLFSTSPSSLPSCSVSHRSPAARSPPSPPPPLLSTSSRATRRPVPFSLPPAHPLAFLFFFPAPLALTFSREGRRGERSS